MDRPFGTGCPRPVGWTRSASPRAGRRTPRRLNPEILEDRQLLAASLAPIADLSVPSQQGYTLPLDGSGTSDAQGYTITRLSGSSDIGASVAQGPFWTLDVQYNDPTNAANNFSGSLVFQLFGNLTPNTVAEIEKFTDDGYYNGKTFHRVVAISSTPGDDIFQGGAPTTTGSGTSGQPGTPFLNEAVQSLAFTGSYQLAMANAGIDPSSPGASTAVNTDDTQFFVTTAAHDNALSYGYTIFGQMIAGQGTIARMSKVPVQPNPVLGFEDSLPLYPLTITSATLSATNPSGVALVDTTQARPGDSATFLVTATDPSDGTSVSHTFTVTAGAYEGPANPAIDLRPLADPIAATVAANGPTTVALQGHDGYPNPSMPGTLSYSIVSPPSHGTISDFDPSTGHFVYTPEPGYTGTDTLVYQVQEVGPAPPIGTSQTTGQPVYAAVGATTTSDPAAVTLTVTSTPAPTPTPTPSPSPTATPSPTPPTPPPVTLTGVTDVVKGHQVTEVVLTFSGALDPSSADSLANYQLIKQGPRGVFAARKGTALMIRSAAYDPSRNTVVLTPRRPFALTKAVEVVVSGGGLTALRDSLGRPIVGGGQPGRDATAVLSRSGVAMSRASAPAAPPSTAAPVAIVATIDSPSTPHRHGRRTS